MTALMAYESDSLTQLLPGTEVHARGLRWEVVTSERLRATDPLPSAWVEHAVLGHEFDLLSPFEPIEPVQHALHPERAAPLTNWLVYHQAFLLEQALGPSALLAVQPGGSASSRTSLSPCCGRSA